MKPLFVEDGSMVPTGGKILVFTLSESSKNEPSRIFCSPNLSIEKWILHWISFNKKKKKRELSWISTWHDIRNLNNCRPSGRLYSCARMRNSRLKKSHNFQRLTLLSILYDDFLTFSENRDKKFKLGSTYFNFCRTGNYITSCTLVI